MEPESLFRTIEEAIGTQKATIVRADIERLAGRIKSLKEPRALTRRGVRDWYTGPMDSHRFWPALRSFLESKKRWSPDVIDSIDGASSKILGLLQPPGLGEFSTRGLVLGHVQSGKTSNFTAVISKAADVQYKVFIVLSGMHNTLRAQTQKRLDHELAELVPDHWISLTDAEKDFGHLPVRADALLTDKAHQKVLVVVKKNAFRLARLKQWLASANASILRACPILVIDDEADQASLNAAKYDAERSRINQLIIDILGLLPKHAYVGYTATPFANVLVDPGPFEDLYPRDFIVDLPRPAGYFGTEAIFGRRQLEYLEEDEPDDGLDLIRRVQDDEVPFLRPRGRTDREAFAPQLVSSLQRAIRYFWLATAARRARGQDDAHSSMLVHTSMLTRVHDGFQPLIEGFKDSTRARLRDSLSEQSAFRSLWEDEAERLPPDPSHPPTPFDSLLPHLEQVITDTLVCVENNRSIERLDYDDGHRVRIVVGGNTLSRGLTLEGLVVSYFVRSAGAYDTLLQMGRWFGYRRGYSDLPRLWMTSELEGFFRDLALVEEEIRRDIRRYEEYELTPDELAVRIRVHPTLAVTSRLKMQAAKEIQHSYSGDRPQTVLFEHKDSAILKRNRTAVSSLLGSLTNADGILPEKVQQSVLLRHASPDRVLKFFRDFQFHPDNQRLRSDLLVGYVSKQLERGGLTDWSVAVVGKERVDAGTIDLGLQGPVPLIQRSRLAEPPRSYAYVGAIMSPGDQYLDLRGGKDRPATTGLLLIYPIARDSQPRRTRGTTKRVSLGAVDDVIGIAVVFPEVAPGHDTPSYVAVDLPPLDVEAMDEFEDLPADEGLAEGALI